jgi:two-component system, NtrC family, response regulator HydG
VPTSEEASTILRSREPVTQGTYTLIVESGADAGLTESIGASYLRMLVGKSPTCHIRLTDREVSRRHLAFERTLRGLRVSDLGSTNGTFVNGVRIESAYLEGGERLQIGATTLRVERGETVRADPPPRQAFGRVIGSSPQMRELYELCDRVAAVELPVLIEGETGTGKEVLAESIHEASPRAAGPFIVFDCTAVPPNLAESELFGHERGAFTGAVATRPGVFEQADGGTLFIDEIGELEISLQPKLLRAIERSEVRRVGGSRWLRVDVRILSATRRDMDEEVQCGRFRDDLFFRLAVARLELPPLRARAGDVLVLLRHFWAEFGGKGAVPYDVSQRFERHTWPGNVRELRNAVVHQIALGDASFERQRLPAQNADALETVLAEDLPYPRARDLIHAEFERRYLERVLANHGGSVAKAAAAAGIARRYFNRILARRKE